MYLKRLLAFLCCFTLVFCLFPSSAFATGGNGNIDGGGGSMGHGTSSNFWNSGNDGVRITVVDASSGTAVSSPLDFSNRTQKTSLLHFGKVNKLQYLGGAGLSLQSGVAYSCIRPTQSMPTIVSSKGQSNIEAIKRYFCSEYLFQQGSRPASEIAYSRSDYDGWKWWTTWHQCQKDTPVLEVAREIDAFQNALFQLPEFRNLDTLTRFCRGYAQPTSEPTEFNLYSETAHFYIWLRLVTRHRDYNAYVHYYLKG